MFAQGVLLNMALINYAMSFLVRRGYTPVQTPFFMRKVRIMRMFACDSVPL
jgi:seryl-tRNA synthetase